MLSITAGRCLYPLLSFLHSHFRKKNIFGTIPLLWYTLRFRTTLPIQKSTGAPLRTIHDAACPPLGGLLLNGGWSAETKPVSVPSLGRHTFGLGLLVAAVLQVCMTDRQTDRQIDRMKDTGKYFKSDRLKKNEKTCSKLTLNFLNYIISLCEILIDS